MKKSRIFWFIITLAAFGFLAYASYNLYLMISTWTFLPARYLEYIKYGLMGFCGFFGFLAILPFVNNFNKILQTIITVVLAAGLTVVNMELPNYKTQLERNFTEVPTEGELNISVYVKEDSTISEINDLKTTILGFQSDCDLEYQEYALKVMNREIGGNIETKEYPNIYDLAQALIDGEINAIMLNDSYTEILDIDNDLAGFVKNTKTVYTCTQQIQLTYDDTAVGNITKEPFVVMIGGNDSWNNAGLNKTVNCGRTDVNICAIVNPNTKQALIVTIPRDSYVGLGGNSSQMDKLTHATVYSISKWEKTISALLGCPINYYARVNFLCIINIIDAMGGVDIYNPYSFYSDSIDYKKPDGKMVYNEKRTYEKGMLHLDGKYALGYVRERHHLQNGDMGRNEHQAIIIKGMVDKLTSVAVITHITDLLETISGSFATDMSIDQIYALCQMQLDDMATWDLITYSLTGSTGARPSYAMGQQELSMVILNQNSVNEAINLVNQILNNEILTYGK